MQSQQDNIERITSEELKTRVDRGEDLVIVDARSQVSFDASNIRPKGAVRIAPGTTNGEMDRLPRNKLVVTVCT
ncbi:MAG: hypothetical protein HYX92_15780 [Chloroflexi bacterium]|nr:hypothetical protein [Chloroflexota bacterium]